MDVGHNLARGVSMEDLKAFRTNMPRGLTPIKPAGVKSKSIFLREW